MKKKIIQRKLCQHFVLCLTMLFGYVHTTFAQSGYVGETIYLSAPSTPGTIGGAAWLSSNTSCVSVSGDHYGATVEIIAYFSGTVTITCQYVYSYMSGGKIQYSSTQRAYYYISCKQSRVTLDKREVTIKPSQEVELTYTNSSGFELPFGTWTTSDKSIAVVDWGEKSYGQKTVTVTGIDVGECVITFEGNTGMTAPTCKINVIATPPTSIVITPEKLSLKEGEKGNFSYKLSPSDAYAKVTWKSSDETVAKVSTSGAITAVGGGTAQITVTTDNGLSAQGIVEVAPLPQQVSLNDQQVPVGYAIQMQPTLYPSNSKCTYKWMSDDSKTVSVNSLGLVRGIKEGSASITVTTENGKTATCRVTVKNPSSGMEYENVQPRVSVLKNLIKKSVDNIK